MRLAARLVHFEPSSRLISASIHCRAVSMMFETFRLRLQKGIKTDAQFEQTPILPLILCSFASGAVLHTFWKTGITVVLFSACVRLCVILVVVDDLSTLLLPAWTRENTSTVYVVL